MEKQNEKRLDVDQGLLDKEKCSTVEFLSDSGGFRRYFQVSLMKTLRGFVLALDDHQCSNVVDKLVKARCLHVPPPGGWRVVGGAHGPGVVQGLAQHVEPGGEHVERSTEGGTKMTKIQFNSYQYLPSLFSMKCLNTTGPMVNSALRVLTFSKIT